MPVNRIVSYAKQSYKGVKRNLERKDSTIGDGNVTSTVVCSTNTMSRPATGIDTTSRRPAKETKTTQETSAGPTTVKTVKGLHALRKVLRMHSEKYFVPVASTSRTSEVMGQEVALPGGPGIEGASSADEQKTLPRVNGAKITVPAQVHVNGTTPRNTVLGLKDGVASVMKTESGYKLIYSLNHVFGNEPTPGTSKDDENQRSETLVTSTQRKPKKISKPVRTTKKIKKESNTQATGKKDKTTTDSLSIGNQKRGPKRKACTCVMCLPDSGKRQKASNPDQDSDSESSNLPDKSNTVNQTGEAPLDYYFYL